MSTDQSPAALVAALERGVPEPTNPMAAAEGVWPQQSAVAPAEPPPPVEIPVLQLGPGGRLFKAVWQSDGKRSQSVVIGHHVTQSACDVLGVAHPGSGGNASLPSGIADLYWVICMLADPPTAGCAYAHAERIAKTGLLVRTYAANGSPATDFGRRVAFMAIGDSQTG